MASKRRRQGEEEGQDNRHVDRWGNKHRSLYLVLDDWDRGFTIRKLDADNPPDLSAPPLFRLASPQNHRAMDFAALGSNIIATSNQCAATVVLDTETTALAVGNPLPEALRDALNFFVTAGDDDMLFAFAYYFMSGPPSLELMTTAPKDELRSMCPSTDWSWEIIPTPFTKNQRVMSYALHPDGRTIFASVNNGDGNSGTFSYDSGKRKWRRHGEWMLPFQRQGYFDADLDAWVGLHRDGYICSCQLPSLSTTTTTTTMQQPSWKMAKDQKLWSTTRQVSKSQGATLTYMGNSRFFLVDCVVADGFEFQDAFGDPNGCVLNMTTFRLKYNHEGKLRFVDRNTTSRPFSKQLSSFTPVAFWV